MASEDLDLALSDDDDSDVDGSGAAGGDVYGAMRPQQLAAKPQRTSSRSSLSSAGDDGMRELSVCLDSTRGFDDSLNLSLTRDSVATSRTVTRVGSSSLLLRTDVGGVTSTVRDDSDGVDAAATTPSDAVPHWVRKPSGAVPVRRYVSRAAVPAVSVDDATSVDVDSRAALTPTPIHSAGPSPRAVDDDAGPRAAVMPSLIPRLSQRSSSTSISRASDPVERRPRAGDAAGPVVTTAVVVPVTRIDDGDAADTDSSRSRSDRRWHSQGYGYGGAIGGGAAAGAVVAAAAVGGAGGAAAGGAGGAGNSTATAASAASGGAASTGTRIDAGPVSPSRPSRRGAPTVKAPDVGGGGVAVPTPARTALPSCAAAPPPQVVASPATSVAAASALPARRVPRDGHGDGGVPRHAGTTVTTPSAIEASSAVRVGGVPSVPHVPMSSSAAASDGGGDGVGSGGAYAARGRQRHQQQQQQQQAKAAREAVQVSPIAVSRELAPAYDQEERREEQRQGQEQEPRRHRHGGQHSEHHQQRHQQHHQQHHDRHQQQASRAPAEPSLSDRGGSSAAAAGVDKAARSGAGDTRSHLSIASGPARYGPRAAISAAASVVSEMSRFTSASQYHGKGVAGEASGGRHSGGGGGGGSVSGGESDDGGGSGVGSRRSTSVGARRMPDVVPVEHESEWGRGKEPPSITEARERKAKAKLFNEGLRQRLLERSRRATSSSAADGAVESPRYGGGAAVVVVHDATPSGRQRSLSASHYGSRPPVAGTSAGPTQLPAARGAVGYMSRGIAGAHGASEHDGDDTVVLPHIGSASTLKQSMSAEELMLQQSLQRLDVQLALRKQRLAAEEVRSTGSTAGAGGVVAAAPRRHRRDTEPPPPAGKARHRQPPSHRVASHSTANRDTSGTIVLGAAFEKLFV